MWSKQSEGLELQRGWETVKCRYLVGLGVNCLDNLQG